MDESNWNAPEGASIETDKMSDVKEKKSSDEAGSQDKAMALIEKVAMQLHQDQVRSRRWRTLFKSVVVIYLMVVGFIAVTSVGEGAQRSQSESYAAVIEVNGVIAADQDASADAVIGALRDAFKDDKALGVILRINSPGGSPVQSGYIYDEIKRLKQTREEFPVYAVIMDLGASGAYYIAAAADEIYADKASLVGSIGVVGSGFGFVDAMKKLGIERRQYTAGDHKGFLDPFTPENPEEKAFWQSVLKVTHNQFIDQVRKGRGDRLKENPELFSGLVWSGEQALELGLIDGLSSTSRLAREKLETEDLVNFTYQPAPWEELVSRLGASVGQGIATQVMQQLQINSQAPVLR